MNSQRAVLVCCRENSGVSLGFFGPAPTAPETHPKHQKSLLQLKDLAVKNSQKAYGLT